MLIIDPLSRGGAINYDGQLTMMKLSLCLVVGIIVTIPTAALAYIDPTSGGLLLQLLLGGFAGLMVLAKLYWRKLYGLFSRRKPKR